MRGKLRKKLLKSGMDSLYINCYPPMRNAIKSIYPQGILTSVFTCTTNNASRKKENELYQEIAGKIFVKRMKSLMPDANGLFNKDALEVDFFTYAANY